MSWNNKEEVETTCTVQQRRLWWYVPTFDRAIILMYTLDGDGINWLHQSQEYQY